MADAVPATAEGASSVCCFCRDDMPAPAFVAPGTHAPDCDAVLRRACGHAFHAHCMAHAHEVASPCPFCGARVALREAVAVPMPAAGVDAPAPARGCACAMARRALLVAALPLVVAGVFAGVFTGAIAVTVLCIVDLVVAPVMYVVLGRADSAGFRLAEWCLETLDERRARLGC
jgi:hypothetical protein